MFTIPLAVLKVSAAVGSRLCRSNAAMTGFGGVRFDFTVVGRGPLAFSGCMGQCASTYNLHAMECPKEVRPYSDLIPFEDSRRFVWAQHPS